MYVDISADYKAEWRRYAFGEGILKNIVYDSSLAVLNQKGETSEHLPMEKGTQSAESTSDSN